MCQTKSSAISERCQTATKLRRIYIFTTFVCLFMALYITNSLKPFFLALIGKDSSSVRKAQADIELNILYLPPKLLTKYEGHNLVAITHIAPALFWVLAIPIQFHRGIRMRFHTFHKYIGRIFIFTSFLMMVGVAVIFQRGLTYENYLEGTKPITLPLTNMSLADTLFIVTSIRFVQTGALAIAYARKREFDEHRIWIIRHCAMGLWVVLMRIISILVSPFYLMAYGPVQAPGYIRGRIFFWCGAAGVVSSYSIGEYAIRLLGEKARDSNKKAK